MILHKTSSIVRAATWGMTTIAAAAAMPGTLAAQPVPADHAAHPATAPTTMPLADEVAQLRAKVSRLEAALQSRQMGRAGSSGVTQPMPGMGQAAAGGAAMPGMAAGSAGAGGMGMMDDNMMGMRGGGKPPMGQMQGMSGGGGGGGGMGMMKGMMGGEMGGMGSMGSMPNGGGGGMSGMNRGMMDMMGMAPAGGSGMGGGGMAMPSALPGFPGASHLYHIGSTGFFLDHAEHITLTTAQQTALNGAKEKALLAKADSQRKIDAAEQELWTLTAADEPDAAKIEAKVQEIEKLRGDQRLGFIRAVGEAAKALTAEQRKSLLGQLPPQPSQPASGGGMGGGMSDM